MKRLGYTILFILVIQFKTEAQISLPNLQANQYVSTSFGNALNFDGTSTFGLGKAYLKDSLTDFTIEFWIQNTGTDGANDIIYSSALNNALKIAKSSTQLKLMATDLGGPSTWQTACTLELNKWVHIAIIRNGTSMKLYKNAALEKTYTLSTSTSILPSFFFLGSNIMGAGDNGNFSIDELRIWKFSVPTTPTNYIQKYMYSSVNPNATIDQNPSTKLVLYYKFDQGLPGENNTNELGLFNSATSN